MFSPDGRTLASGSRDTTVRLWDVFTGAEVRILEGHTDWVMSVAYSPDGRTLVTGSSWPDKTVRLWDVLTRAEVPTLEGHTSSVLGVAFSPNGWTLAGGSLDKTVRLWDVPTGAQVRTLTGHTDSVTSVAFSPDGRTLASGSWGEIRLWNASTGDGLRALEGHTSSILSVAFSPDGHTLASGSMDGTVLLWELGLATTWGNIKRIAVADITRHSLALSLSADMIIPTEMALLPNYPNPFNPETWIPYQLAVPAEVTLTIYNLNGGAVRRLDAGHQAAGLYRSQSRAAYWDGRNQRGESVASGIYFYTLRAGEFTATRKMLIRK